MAYFRAFCKVGIIREALRKAMEHHIAVNIFKDFSTGCYQITIGCNDDIVGETKDGKKYHITAIMLL